MHMKTIRIHCPQSQRKMNRLITKSIGLILVLLISCNNKDFTQKILQEVITDLTVVSELSRIDSITNLQFVNITPGGVESQIEYFGLKMSIPCDTSLLNEIKKSTFRRSNSQLVVIDIGQIKRRLYVVNLYHPNSGLLLVSELEFSGQTPIIIETKIQSI